MRPTGGRKRPSPNGLAALSAVLSGLFYLASAARTHRLGLPLDDAWIHQTYARNLAELGQWSFLPGAPSAGSTAPLWTAGLAVGYWLKIEPLLFAYGLGVALLGTLVWLVSRWVGELVPARSEWAWTVGLLVGLEWHLAWSSVSGMETLAVAVVAVLVLRKVERRRAGPVGFGLLTAVGVWLRPEALLLLMVPLGLFALRSRRSFAGNIVRLAIGLALGLIPYLTWQRSLSGQWWPNTASAKPAEYAALREIPLAIRIAGQAGIPASWFGEGRLHPGGPLVGAMSALLPGMVLFGAAQARARRWDRLLGLAWSATHLGLYAVRLPATYQHGRYAMPVLPVWIALAGAGLLAAAQPGSIRRVWRVVWRGWIAVVPIVTVSFWLAGARAYGQDVAIIESEMVEVARWVDRQTPPGALVAAHDIGALGYFGGRPLLDLAGLIEPRVVPILRDEAALARFLSEQGADFLVAFPGWYPALTAGRVPLHVSGGRFSPAAGGENLAVYRWDSTSVAPCLGCAILAASWQGRP